MVNMTISTNKTNATSTSLYLYSAFYDNRFQVPTIRVLGVIPKELPKDIWCVVFVPGSKFVAKVKAVVKISEYVAIVFVH